MIGDPGGNIRSQIGRSLNIIRKNVEEADVDGLTNQVTFFVSVAYPVLKAQLGERVGELSFEGIPAGDDVAIFRRANEIVRVALDALTDAKVYAWRDEEPGDASGLALTDDEA